MNKYDLEVKPTAVNPIAIKPVLTKPDSAIGSGDGLSHLGLPIILVVAILMLAKAWEVVSAKNVTIDYFHKYPCWNCHFFTNNHYLPCTVRPSSVLTEQALDCSDHRSK